MLSLGMGSLRLPLQFLYQPSRPLETSIEEYGSWQDYTLEKHGFAGIPQVTRPTPDILCAVDTNVT